MQYSAATGWTAPVTVGGSNSDRKMFIDNTGQAVLAYTAIDPATARFDLVSRTLSFGGQWSTAGAIETTDGSVGNATFSMNQRGQGVVIWTQNDVANSSVRNSLWSAVLR
jgi:hypothetical protein